MILFKYIQFWRSFSFGYHLLAFLVVVSCFILAPGKAIAAASCPVSDGGAGDGDASVNGVITISSNQAWTAPGSPDNGEWDCTGVDIVVQSGTILTLRPYNDGDTDYTDDFQAVLNVDNLTVESTASISSNNSGYAGGTSSSNSGFGPCAGSGYDHNNTEKPGAGGGYGGIGGDGFETNSGGCRYGYFLTLTRLGSGGGRGEKWFGDAEDGGAGGGSIKLNVSGTTTINGTISANGQSRSKNGGAGSGGSVHILTANLSGSGSISANGGSANVGGHGGGGRVRVDVSNSSSFSGSLSADSGGSDESQPGSALIINTNESSLTVQSDQTWDASSDEGGTILSYDTVTITNSSALSLFMSNQSSSSDAEGFSFITNTFTLGSGSNIYGKGRGYNGGIPGSYTGKGPGGGAGQFHNFGDRPGAGGGHGGSGGNGFGSGGSAYGSALQPITVGSGGGRGEQYFSSQKNGAAGGSSISIVATEQANILGNISMGGGDAACKGGAGAGGSIQIVTNSLTGSGNLDATGGDAANGCGAGSGSGGRIALITDTNNLSGTISVAGGQVANAGSDGTFFKISSLSQRSDEGEITIGDSTQDTTPSLQLTIDDAPNGDYSVEFELQEVGTDFADVATHTSSNTTFSGTAVDISKTVSELENGDYHWQVRVCDVNDLTDCTRWISYGGNDETAVDFTVNSNFVPNEPTNFGPSRLVSNGYTNANSSDVNNALSFSFSLSDPDDAEQVSFQIQIDDNSDFSSPVIDYVSETGDEGVRSFTVGQAAASGAVYNSGSESQILPDGTYYWQVKATDDQGVSSSYASHSSNSFEIDTTNPSTNASDMTMTKNSSETLLVTDGSGKKWTNDLSPYFSWTAGSDADSELQGYCLYLGTDPDGDPRTTKGLLGTSPESSYSDCQFIVPNTSIDFATTSYRGGVWLSSSDTAYYFKAVAIDNAGNTFNGSDDTNTFTFYYDDTNPTNSLSISAAGSTFSNIDDMYFSWPSLASDLGAEDSHSQVLGYQYSLNDQVSWTGTTTSVELGLDYIPVGTATPFYLTNARDEDSVVVGDNIVYFRTIDNAGNISSSATYRTASISYGGDAPTFDGDAVVTVTPSSNTENNFALSWPAANPSDGNTIASYYYMINTTPPSTLSVLENNSSTYVASTSLSVDQGELSNLNRGSNTVYVVAVDSNDNYSPSNRISATFTLDSDDPDSPDNLVVSDASIKSAELWRASLAWDEPSYIGTGGLTYTVQRSTDGESWSDVSTTTGLSYVDTVSKSQKYYWRVGSSDTNDSSLENPTFSNAITLIPTGTFTEPAGLTSGPVASSITTKRATISWTTDRTADSKIAYGTSSGNYLDEESSNSDQVTEHTIKLNNLSPGTTYYYVSKWTDEDGNTGTSEEKTFTTDPAPTVKDVQVSNIGVSSAIVRFTTNNASAAKILYGTTTSFGGIVEQTTSVLETTYTVELSGLQDGTQYYFQINTIDSEGDEYEGTILDFDTLPRPTVSDIRIEQVDNSAQPTLVITWQSNTEISSIISYYPRNNPALQRDQVDIQLIEGEHQMVLRGLLPETNYVLRVRGRDIIGNEALSDNISFTTATDTRPPQIANLSVEGTSSTQLRGDNESAAYSVQLVVSWDTDEPSTSQVEYGEGTGSNYSQVTPEDSSLTFNHVVVLNGLSPAKVYHLRVISKDSEGNEIRSADKVKITPKINEGALDLVIGNLREVFSFLEGV